MVQPMKLCQVFVLAFILLLSISTTNAGRLHRLQRSTEEETTTSETEHICRDNTPCGWAVYTPFTRKVDYFMKNTCMCQSEYVCLKTDDDLSVSAYVYRCRQLKKDGDTNSS